MSKTITQLVDAGALVGDEFLELAQVSSTVHITAATISALASDNSFNDSGNGFVTAGFAVGHRVKVTGFTGNVANNIVVATITALTTGKMTIGGADGNVIVDDAAGESVTIAKWESRKATAQDIADLGGGGAGAGVVGLPSITTSHSSNATDLFHGSRFLPFVNMTVDGIAWQALRAASGTQQFNLHIVTLSNTSGAGSIGAILATSATVTVGGPGSLPTGGVADITPLALTAGTQYGIVAERVAADPNRTGVCAANSMVGGVAGMLLTGFATSNAFAAAAAFLNSATPFTLGVRTAA